MYYCLFIGSINKDEYEITQNRKKVNFYSLGGSALNTCYFFQILLQMYQNKKTKREEDVKVRMIGVVGNDDTGKWILETLKKKQISTDFVFSIEDVLDNEELDESEQRLLSGKTRITLSPEGERTIQRFEKKTVTSLLPRVMRKLPLIKKGFPCSSFNKKKNNQDTCIIHTKGKSHLIKAIEHSLGRVYSIDISSLSSESYVNYRGIHATTLFGNTEEFYHLYKNIKQDHSFLVQEEERKKKVSLLKSEIMFTLNDIEKIMKFFQSTYLFLKMGKKGAMAFVKEEENMRIFRGTTPLVSVKDTTGAGDAFNAGILFGLYQEDLFFVSQEKIEEETLGKALKKVLKKGIALGSYNCTEYGAQSLVPSKGKYEELQEATKVEEIEKKDDLILGDLLKDVSQF